MSDNSFLSSKIESMIDFSGMEERIKYDIPFSDQAYSTLRTKIAEYASDLAKGAIEIAKYHQADNVSAVHVEHASSHLVSCTKSRFFKHLGIVGGILLGAALSNVLAMTLVTQLSTFGIVITIIMGIVGAFMVALHIAKD